MVRECHDEYSHATGPIRRAHASQALLGLLMYTAITPGRVKEYATLELKVVKVIPPMEANVTKNIIQVEEKGGKAMLVLGAHKTAKHQGADHVILKKGNILLKTLVRHVKKHRGRLLQGQEHRYLFTVSLNRIITKYTTESTNTTTLQNKRGGPFNPASWSNYIQEIFFKFTGKKILPSILRSSFITYNEGTNISGNLKEAVASSMRHSRHTVSLVNLWSRGL